MFSEYLILLSDIVLGKLNIIVLSVRLISPKSLKARHPLHKSDNGIFVKSSGFSCDTSFS